jgi:hypothetical protein
MMAFSAIRQRIRDIRSARHKAAAAKRAMQAEPKDRSDA